MTALIYNKPADSHSYDTTATDMRKNPIVLCADMDEYELYTPIRLKRRRVRKETRRIRKDSRRFSFSAAFFATAFALLTAVTVLYVSHYEKTADNDIKNTVVHFLSKTSETAGEIIESAKQKLTKPDDNDFSVNSIPVYLEAGAKDDATESPQRVIYANGYLSENNFESAEVLTHEGTETEEVSSLAKGKSGSDGKVYLPLVSRNLSSENMLLLSNETKLSPDMHTLSETAPKAYNDLVISEKPLVLIVHTHATECYTSGNDGVYEKNEPSRSDNIEENVVAVGKVLSETLENFGIPVLHSTTLHDKESFLNAYTSSLNEVHRILGENPSIRFVIDLHRDAIVSSSGEKTAPVTNIAGENYAQLMFVMGTNEAGFNHPDWEDNLCFAIDMQEAMNKAFPGIMRPINLRRVSFNEQLSSGYVLLEAGATGNTLEEAKRSAGAFGTVLAGKILKNAKV